MKNVPPHHYNPHMQIQTPAVNPQAKFQISPQEASDLANIPSSRNYQQEERNKAPTSNWNTPFTPLKADPATKNFTPKRTKKQ